MSNRSNSCLVKKAAKNSCQTCVTYWCCRGGSFIRPVATLVEKKSIERKIGKSDIFEKVAVGYQIKTTKNGYCACFDSRAKTCRVYDVRPFDCRMFPFDFLADGTWVAFDCPYTRTLDIEKELQQLEKNYASELQAIWYTEDPTDQLDQPFKTFRKLKIKPPKR